MLKLKRGNYDNVSISPSKSSKTVRTKLNNNPETENKVAERPYFKEDAIRDEIYARAKKENQKTGSLVRRSKEDHLGKAGKIV